MKKILVIEDNKEIRENIVEILELDGYKTVEAGNGKEGVQKALEELPDLIICDIMMPELDGYGVLHILVKKEATANIPFIFLTAKAERTDMRKGMNLGADDYLTKPFEDTELLDAIEIRLRKAEALRKEYLSNAEGLNEFIKDAKNVHDLNHLHADKKARQYKKKHDIYREGEYANYVYFLVSGKVKSIRTNEDGKELITGIYTAGEFFGYETLLENKEHDDSAETMEDSEIIFIPRDEFFDLVYTNRDVSRKFIEMLSNKVTEKEQKLLNLAYNSVRQRTAEALLTVSEKFNPEGTESFELGISRDDLANMVGTATESVIRVISDLKDEGIIETRSGRIVIKDKNKLLQIQRWHFAK
ncbi:transcriptional regulator, Crp/Fnr family [Fulvivirga imtechensis AK7]|uniref:Transcriptional regulator, Crp/Fnr family n=1 Tax=Fulvivirga imtechensis AK7 TaxID=1237149 RepID=L8JT22_9BACT|nr:response regulator [Fulvivirga imtechensis]ELR71995.1 transcriptional regulator, Crp/Fnr family [Fulvivirga imtechensis AK7]